MNGSTYLVNISNIMRTMDMLDQRAKLIYQVKLILEIFYDYVIPGYVSTKVVIQELACVSSVSYPQLCNV